MKNHPETILFFNLSEEESKLVERLIVSYDIETVSLTVDTIKDFITEFPDRKISLIVYHIEENQKKVKRVIKQIRDLVGLFVPFLILVPMQQYWKIDKFITAGADDFIKLPMGRNKFSISFLVMLEMGLAIVRSQIQKSPKEEGSATTGRTELSRIANIFQADLNFFTPKALIQRKRSVSWPNKWGRVKKLGHGEFGSVWLLEEMSSGRRAVAKIPHSSERNGSVLRSAAILKRLGYHPNIVELYEVVRDGGKLVLIQEYVEGLTLRQLLEHSIPPVNKESYLLQLLSAISYSHKQKILHRDIRPDNIIISKSGQLKLLDFGIAGDLSFRPEDGNLMRTGNFIPPEQHEGQSCIASDVWALGVILYIFATNVVPCVPLTDRYRKNIEMTVERRAPRKINPSISPGLERIIMTCLKKDPCMRYCDATHMLDDLVTTFPGFGRDKSTISCVSGVTVQ